MKRSPRKTVFLISRLVLILTALFSGVNIAFALLSVNRLMPMALSLTGYLTKAGILLADKHQNAFFTIFSAALAAIVCLTLLLCAAFAGKNRGLLSSAAIIVLADCIGIAVLILGNGYSQGYWFELVGHGVIILALIIAFFSLPKKQTIVSQS